MRKDFAVNTFFFAAAAAYSHSFCELLSKYLYISKLTNIHIIRQVFFRLQFSVDESYGSLSLAWRSIHAVLEHGDFLNTYISQGRAATHLRFGGIFSNYFTANSLLNQPVKEFWKSVKMWRSYRCEFRGFLFGTQCRQWSYVIEHKAKIWRKNEIRPTSIDRSLFITARFIVCIVCYL